VKSITKAHIAVLLTNFFFAINYSLVKIISPSLVGAYAVNIFRVGISIFLFWTIWFFGKNSIKIERKHWGRFLFCAIAGIGLNLSFFIKGLTLTSAIHASLLTLVTPILVSFFAMWILKEKFSYSKVLGLILGISGAFFLVMQKENTNAGGNYFLGDLLIFFNAIFYAAYFIAVKPLMKTYDPLVVMRWIFTIGFLMLLPIGWKNMAEIKWAAFNFTDTIILITVAVMGTFFAYYFNVYGLQHLSAGVAGAYIYTQPVFAVLIASIFLHESFNWQKAISAILIFAGVYLVSFHRKNKNNTI